jgi:DNA-directed RNA polymerase specialized sigma24 family protein
LVGGKSLDYVRLAKLHWLEELAPKEIAARMNRSINTIHWAIRKLRRGMLFDLNISESLRKQITARATDMEIL